MKVPSARDRYSEVEREASGCVADWRWGPLLLVKGRHPSRWHRQTMLANLINWHWLPLPSRRVGAYREQWLLKFSYPMWVPVYRARHWLHNLRAS